jgi:hypothetical protein
VREGTLPEQVEIRLCANGVQLLDVCGGEGEPQILRAWNWEDVAFWRLRAQPPLETDSQEELMDLLMIGSRTPDPAEVAKASLNGGSGAIPAVMTFEVEHGAVVRSSFEACCPWTRDERLSAARAATAAACIAGPGDEALWKATPLREPCCVVYPVNQPSAATTAPGTQPLPQLVLLRIGGEGIQLTSAGSAPRALCAWAWADLAFWHFEVQHTDSEHHDDSMDLLVIGTYPFRPAEFPQSASSARTLSILKMETEEIDEIRIALEMFCPQVPEPLPLIAAYDHMANGLELSCFEVFPIAEIDQRGGSSPAFHNLPERVRLCVSPMGGVTMLHHESDGGMGRESELQILGRWAWSQVSEWRAKSGHEFEGATGVAAGLGSGAFEDEPMDLFRFKINGQSFFQCEVDDACIVTAAFTDAHAQNLEYSRSLRAGSPITNKGRVMI